MTQSTMNLKGKREPLSLLVYFT